MGYEILTDGLRAVFIDMSEDRPFGPVSYGDRLGTPKALLEDFVDYLGCEPTDYSDEYVRREFLVFQTARRNSPEWAESIKTEQMSDVVETPSSARRLHNDLGLSEGASS